MTPEEKKCSLRYHNRVVESLQINTADYAGTVPVSTLKLEEMESMTPREREIRVEDALTVAKLIPNTGDQMPCELLYLYPETDIISEVLGDAYSLAHRRTSVTNVFEGALMGRPKGEIPLDRVGFNPQEDLLIISYNGYPTSTNFPESYRSHVRSVTPDRGSKNFYLVGRLENLFSLEDNKYFLKAYSAILPLKASSGCEIVKI